MLTKFLSHLRQQSLGALSLFIVLGGTSYAVATNSIGSAQLKNNSVQSKDIRNGQVSTADVRDRSLAAVDFKAGQLPAGPRGISGAMGTTGPAGPQGLKGDTGTVDTSNFYTKTASDERFLGIGAKAADADKVDGKEASAFAPATLFGDTEQVPDSNQGGTVTRCYIGEVFLTAADFTPPATDVAAGQVLPINSNQALYSLLGTSYGGNGRDTFALPDLRGAAPRSTNGAPMHYVICTAGPYPS